jgi:hypothetical protein
MKPGELQFDQNFYKQVGRMWLLLPDHIKGWFLLSQAIFEEFLIFFTSPIEMLLRYRFGVRSLSMFMVLQLVTTAWVLMTVLARTSPASVLFAATAAAASIYHCWEARRIERHGETHRHTYSPGDPLPFWQSIRSFLAGLGVNRERWLSDWMITRFGEPALCFLAGTLLYVIVPWLATYLLIGSVALLLK